VLIIWWLLVALAVVHPMLAVVVLVGF